MNIHMRKAFIDRVKPGRPHTDHVLSTLESVLQVGDRYMAQSLKLDGDRHLTSDGKKARLSEMSRKDLAPAFAKASSPIRKALRHVETQRAGLTLPKPDKTDFVGALQRQEVRAFLLDLKPQARVTAAKGLVADPAFSSAIFEMPAVMSGLDDASLKMPGFNLYKNMKTDLLMALHGRRLAELIETEEDYREAEAAAIIVRGTLRDASGLSGDGFEKFIRPLEHEADGLSPSFGEPPAPLPFDFNEMWDKVYADVMGRPEVAAA